MKMASRGRFGQPKWNLLSKPVFIDASIALRAYLLTA
jgi:hypothetical protein